MFDVEIKSNKSILDIARTFTGEILYGVPQSTAHIRAQAENGKPTNQTYNNAQILAIMEHGSPIKNIPSRELLTPVRLKHKQQINKALIDICGLLLQGKQQDADVEMEKLAIRIENWTKHFFVENDNGWAPNAPSTIRAKGSDRPLIDTGSLRQSIKAIYYKEGRHEN